MYQYKVKSTIFLFSEAYKKNKQGESLFNRKKYWAAISFFTDALKLCPETGEFYSNRSICYLKLNKLKEAAEDAQRSVELSPTKCLRNFLQIAIETKCLTEAIEFLEMSTFQTELTILKKVQKYDSQAKKAYYDGNYWKLLYCLNQCLDEFPNSVRYNVRKAEILVYVNQFDDAEKIINNLKYFDENRDNEIFLRGLMALYKLGDFEKSNDYFKLILPWSPVFKRMKTVLSKSNELFLLKKSARKAFKNGKLDEAFFLYTKASEIDVANQKINAKLFCGRGTVLVSLKRKSEAIEDYSKSINLDPTFLKPLLKRASLYVELNNSEAAINDYEKAYSMDDKIKNRKLLKENQIFYIKLLSQCAEMHKNREEFEEAVSFYERIYKIDNSIENREKLEEAIFLTNCSQETNITETELETMELKSFYKILGVGRNATQKEIKKAYHEKALIHHPDRHINGSEDEKKNAEERFKEIYKVYKVLSDPIRRKIYDRS